MARPRDERSPDIKGERPIVCVNGARMGCRWHAGLLHNCYSERYFPAEKPWKSAGCSAGWRIPPSPPFPQNPEQSRNLSGITSERRSIVDTDRRVRKPRVCRSLRLTHDNPDVPVDHRIEHEGSPTRRDNVALLRCLAPDCGTPRRSLPSHAREGSARAPRPGLAYAPKATSQPTLPFVAV